MIKRFLRWLGWPTKPPRIPDPLWQKVLAHHAFFHSLNPAEKIQLKTLSEQFLSEKEFSGAGGLELTDRICVTIAAQACLPILCLGLEAYRGWIGIVVYPAEFVVKREVESEDGVVHQYDDVLAGEAWDGGPVILSWRDAKMSDAHYNVVIHEFAHKLDLQNGDADGVPRLPDDLPRSQWEATLLAAYEHFCDQVDSTPDSEGDIDPYAAEDPSEFFAVLSEVFFGRPQPFAARYPELYALFVRFYRQDPLLRLKARNQAH